nr:S41 family peptidase [uncultured Roseateles sp.]
MKKISGRTAAAGALALTVLLAACGGGGGGDTTPPAASCGLADTQSWLLGYMQDQYLWYARMPSVDAAAQPTVEAYFAALLYPGGGADPASRDRWSYVETTASHDQFFGEGRSLGYGLAVGGIELRGRPDEPLHVRYIEPRSPAAAAGLQRGDILLSLNGVSSAEVITRDDFSALTPKAAGDVLKLQVRNAAGDRTVSVTASVFDLTPVSASQVLRSAAGKTTGYLLLKDFISQASTPLDAAFGQFKAAGVTELVLDLRYNGGGLVSVARDLASYIGGQAARGGVFATLKYSDKRQSQNSNFNFEQPSTGLTLSRVFVLSGQRTCSASELVINGLKPFVQVVQIGDTSCGKPVGFVPKAQCGNTFNAVNFESVNAAGAGRYWDGLAPTCRVADAFTRALGDPTEALTAAALSYADSGACPVAAPVAKSLAARPRGSTTTEPGERQGMWLR